MDKKSKLISLGIITALTYILASCAIFSPKSIRDIPSIRMNKVKVSPLKNIPQNNVKLSIIDNRDPQFKVDSPALEKELRRVLLLSLDSQGIAINPNSKNVLLVSVQDQALGKFKDGCVKLNAILTLGSLANIYSDATSCFELESPLSNKAIGSDISESYEMALTTIFENLSKNLEKIDKK